MLDRFTPAKTLVQRALEAAEGWLALGAAQAAWEELEAVEPASRTNPAVLHERARILVALGRLGEAKEAVRRIVTLAPAWRLALLDDSALDPVWM